MSVDFTGQKIKLTYASLLHLDPAGTGISVNFEQVYDGDGTASGLYVSSTGIRAGNVSIVGQQVRLEETPGSDYIALQAPTSVSSIYSITFPGSAPAGDNHILESNASGVLSWIPTPGGGSGTNAFGTIVVSGQSDIVAEAAPDTLTIVAGSGITLTTNAATDTLTITSSITQYTDEMSQDATASLIQSGTGITWSYDDANNTLTPTVSLTPFSTTNLAEGTNLYFTDERVDDRVAALIQNGTGITWSYNDGAGTLTPTVTITQYTDELAQDAVGGILVDSGRIDFTYNDAVPSITADIVAGSITSTYVNSSITTAAFSTISVSGQSDVVADSAADTLTLVAGTNITITTNAGADSITINASGGGGGGDVTAAANLTDNAIVRGDGGAKGVQTSGVIVDDTDNVTGMSTLTLPNTGLHLLDTNASHDLIIAPGSDLTADRTLTITTGDANRTLTLTADSSIGGTAYVVGGTDVPVSDGGTGASSFTAYAVVCGGTTSTNPLQSIASVGSAGEVLTSNGAGALPTFQAAGGGGSTNVGITTLTAHGLISS